jgi:hypothetical protein
MAIKKMQTGGAKKTVKKIDDKTSFKAGLKAGPETLKRIDGAIEKRYPNYTGPTSFYAGLKSGAKTLLGYKKGGVTKEHPLTAFRKANEARQAVVKKSLPKAGLGTIVKGVAKFFGPAAGATGKSSKIIKPATKIVKPTSRVPDVAGDVKFFGKNIGGGGLIGAGIGAGLIKGAELSNKSDNTKVNYNLSTGTKTVVHTGANNKKYVKVTNKDGKTFNKVIKQKTGGAVKTKK